MPSSGPSRHRPKWGTATDPRGPVPDPWGHQEAVAECTEAIRLDPDHPHARIERGDLKSRQGQYEGAIADYDQAIRLDPRNAEAYLNRSLEKSELGRHDEAIADLDRAMRLDRALAVPDGETCAVCGPPITWGPGSLCPDGGDIAL